MDYLHTVYQRIVEEIYLSIKHPDTEDNAGASVDTNDNNIHTMQ